MINRKWVWLSIVAVLLTSKAFAEKEIIWFQSGNTPNLTQQYANNINNAPMQGFTVTVPLGRRAMTPGYSVSYDDVNKQLASKNLELLDKKLFIRIFADRYADFFDDWSGSYQNFRNIARAAKNHGFTGIMFDPEEYAIGWWDYPDDVSYKNRSLAEYQAQARLVGKNIMNAIESEWPGVVFIDVKGSWKSDSDVWWFGKLTGGRPANKSEMIGPLFSGFVEAKDSTTKLYDGGQIYGLRDLEDFEAVYDHRKNVTVNQNWVGNTARAKWDDVGISFVSMNLEYPVGIPMSANIMRTTLINSLTVADDLALLYIEKGELGIEDWIENPMQNNWKSAIQDALDAVNDGTTPVVEPTPVPTAVPTAVPTPQPTSQPENSDVITGTKRITDRWQNRYLHATSADDWAFVRSAPLNESWGSQRWVFEHLQNNRYRIKNEWTQTYLTSGSLNEWDNIYVAPLDKKSRAQKWNVIKQGDYYRFRNADSGLLLNTTKDDWSDILQAPGNTEWWSQQYTIE